MKIEFGWRTRAFILITLFFCTTPAFSGEVIDIPLNGGETQRILFCSAGAAKANVILFPGGDGIVGIKNDGSAENPNHTFTRSMTLWAGHGINAILFDTPGGLGDHGAQRNSTDHLKRISAVIMFLKKKNGLPVWLIGHSNGTLSVSNYINASPENENKVDGLAVLGTERSAEFTRQMKLPILAVHHLHDGCRFTPIEASIQVINAAKLTAPRAELIKLDGGREESKPCKAKSRHGFLGIEDELIARISSFIRKGTDKPEDTSTL